MTETAKQVVHGYYEKAALHAYFTGCSTGRHQALMEAQRYPTDYDGIVAGDPGNDRIRLNIGFLRESIQRFRRPAVGILIQETKNHRKRSQEAPFVANRVASAELPQQPRRLRLVRVVVLLMGGHYCLAIPHKVGSPRWVILAKRPSFRLLHR